MLRGYSRHDGISNKQSAKERDRDRQRERQRQERAQMLPNDDKDISTSAHDLFHAPVKGDPSVADPTTLEIQKTLGNFENVRHILVEGPAGRSLIGVDQNRNPAGAPRPGQPGSIPTTNTKPHPPPKYQPPNSSAPATTNSANTTTNLNNTSQNNYNKSITTTQKVPQNQLSHHPTQPINNHIKVPPNTGVNNNISSHEQNNLVKKLIVNNNNNAYTNNNSGSAETPILKKDKTINNNSVVISDTHSEEITNEKHEKGFPNRKPALERADSQLELESIIKEMMDVKSPINPIQTPAKESPTKKYPTRRGSKEDSPAKIAQTYVPPPNTDMDSSESSSTGSDSSSDSEDSSSCKSVENPDPGISKPGQPNSPARWDLRSFLQKENVRGTPDSSGAAPIKSPKDGKSRENPPTSSTIDSEESPGEVPKVESVSSTVIFGKSLSSSPAENASSGKFTKPTNPSFATHLDQAKGQYSKAPGKSPRKTADVKPDLFPSKLPPQTIPMKGPQAAPTSATSKGASLSATSSEDEEKKPKEPLLLPPPGKTKSQSGGASNKRKWRAASPGHKSDDDDSSPEAEKTKSQAVQDRNKKHTIMKLFSSSKNKGRMDSPSLENEGGKATTTGSTSGSGRGKGSKPSASNRVSAKDSGRKRNSGTAVIVHNGDLEPKATERSGSTSSTSTAAKKARDNTIKEPAPPNATSHHNNRKRSHKSHTSGTTTTSSQKNNTAEGTTPATSNANPTVINTNPSNGGSRIKDEITGKSAPSSLMCRIPLSILLRRPPVPQTTAATTPSSVTVKTEKDVDKGGGTTASLSGNSESSQRVRLTYLDSSRVGSSSDQGSNILHHDPVTDRQKDDPLCSDSEPPSKLRKRPKKKPRSPKKTSSKINREPDSHSHSKLEDDSGVVEVSSNVFGYTPCDSVSVSTTRTPPIEPDPPAPDSSLNPPHLPSPVAPPQPVYFSYFEKNDTQALEDLCSRDQEAYLEEAKRLKHRADNEKLSTTQASMYLEAGLYFILTGISMERAVGAPSAFTMYKDTLSLIRYIGNRFKGSRGEYTNELETKIIILSMRCQSLLSLKLFKIKHRENRDLSQYLQDQFAKYPAPENIPISSSPQLSTPSPHSPTSSPAGGSGILPIHTPSPHPHQNHVPPHVSRTVYTSMYKQFNVSQNLVQAHELWEAADGLVDRFRMQEFFISIDRTCGPLTLHNTLADLVSYVKRCLKVLKLNSDSDIS